MNKKKAGLLIIVLFLIIGLGSFVFANPDNQENFEEGDTEEREGLGSDRVEDEEDSLEDNESDSTSILTDGSDNQNNNQNYTSRSIQGGVSTVADNSNEGTGNTFGPGDNGQVPVIEDYYADALKAVENAESSLAQGDVDYAASLVDKVTNQSQKDELNNRLDAVQDIIDVTALIERLETMVANSTDRDDIVDSISYRNDEKVEELVNNLVDGTAKDNLADRLDAVNKILNDNDSPVISGIDNNSFTRKDSVALTISDDNEVTTKVTLNGNEIGYTHKFTEEGTYVVTVVDAAFNETTLTFTIDRTAPVINGVENGGYYNHDVTITIDEENIQNAKYQYNGKWYSFESGDTFTEEGTYFVRVTDKAYNKKAELTFTIDKTSPEVLNITQEYEDKENGRIKVTITTSEEIYGESVNNYGWRKVGENTYVNYFYKTKDVTINATDKAGNALVYTFTVDMTAPVVKSLGITDINEYKDEVGKLYVKNGDTVRVLIYFEEKLGTEPTVKLGSKEFTATYREASSKPESNSYAYYADIKITKDMNLSDGVVSFEVYGYTDVIGNIGTKLTEANVNMSAYPSVTLDNTKPVLNFNNGFITSEYTVEATDDNFDYMTVQYYDGREMQTIDGNTFALDSEGDNVRYNIKAYDKAGNVSEYRDIYLDNVKPVIEGASTNGVYKEVTLNISDGSLKKVVLVKEDGTEEVLQDYEDNYTTKKMTFEKTYNVEGTYEIKAVDRNKNESTIIFTIDKTKPVITGAENGKYYREDVVLNIDDKNPGTIHLHKDGELVKNYKLGTPLTEEGIYSVYASDKAGNKSATVEFVIDKTSPVVIGVENGGYYREDVTLTIDEVNLQNAKYQKDGGKWTSFKSGDTFTEEGTYFVRVTDKAYNKKAELTFTIDKTKPVVTGAENGKYYREDVVLNIDDKNPGTIHLHKDGELVKNYKLGTPLTEEGIYSVYASDKAGNKSATVEFVIDKTSPVVIGVENGGYYREDVTLTIDEVNLQNAKYQKDGGKWTSFKSGDTFTEEGTYFVRVTDKAYNKKAELTFTIDKTPVALVELRVNSSNLNNQYAKVGDSFGIYLTVNEELRENPIFTVNGKEYKVNQTETVNSGYKYAVVYKVTDDMEEGEISFTISNIYDKAGNKLDDLSNKDTNQKVVIDKTAPTATVTYNTVDPTNHSVIATLTASEDVKVLNAGTWNPDGGYATIFRKSYPENKTQTVTIEDRAGNQSTVEVVINNIDKIGPTATYTVVDANREDNGHFVTFTFDEAIDETSLPQGMSKVSDNTYTKMYYKAGSLTVKDVLGNTSTIEFEF